MKSIADVSGMGARIEQAMHKGDYNCYRLKSAVTEFAVVRHFIRANDERIKRCWDEERRMRKLLARLPCSPFNKHRVDQVKSYIGTVVELRKHCLESEAKLGRILIEMAPRIDAETSAKQRLEILNCNPADRGELDNPEAGFFDLIALHCVEDSAAHRKDEFRSRPLFNAINAEIMRVMFKTPEGRQASEKIFDKAFAPGGILHGVPTYYQQPDGTIKRQAPALVLHDATGSRVIERNAI